MALRGRTENYARVLSEELRTQNLNLPSASQLRASGVGEETGSCSSVTEQEAH